MGGRYTCSLVAEVVPLTCGVDALADSMGSAGTGEVERSSTGPRAQPSCQIRTERPQFGPWARAVAQLVQVSAQPAYSPPQYARGGDGERDQGSRGSQ